MQFKLCLALGVLHPDYLLRELTAQQYHDWQRFSAQVGFGPDRDDHYWAMTLQGLTGHKKIEDFILYKQPQEFNEISKEEFERRIRSMIAK